MRNAKNRLRRYGANLVINEGADPFVTGALMGTIAAIMEPSKKSRGGRKTGTRKRR